MNNIDPDKLAHYFKLASVAGLVLAIWCAIITIWWLKRSKKNQQLQRRLDFAQQGTPSNDDERVIRLWHDGKAVDAFVPDQYNISWSEWLDRLREDAGWITPMPRILAIVASFAVAAFVYFGLFRGNIFMGFAAPAAILAAFRTLLLRAINKQTARFEKQLVDALDLGARSLRAGHPLSGAFKLIAEEIPAPVSTMFREIIEQEALGVSLSKALYNASQKSRNPDMKIFATSVCIQLRSGGNLADMIDRVAWVVRERMRLNRRARVLTAEANMSKWVLIALPLGMFVILYLLNPEYMQPFFTTFPGTMLMIAATIMLCLGAWLMSAMAKLKY